MSSDNKEVEVPEDHSEDLSAYESEDEKESIGEYDKEDPLYVSDSEEIKHECTCRAEICASNIVDKKREPIKRKAESDAEEWSDDTEDSDYVPTDEEEDSEASSDSC
jgi:hypothetical protein